MRNQVGELRLLGNSDLHAFLKGVVAATYTGEACADPQICLDAMRVLKAMESGEVELYET
jgi:hypothetical protein